MFSFAVLRQASLFNVLALTVLCMGCKNESNDPAQWLDQHYPTEWHYEVRDRRIADNEAFVLVRLEVSALGVRKSQFGCAVCDGAANNDELTVESNRSAREKRAYDNAIKDALLRCIELL